MTKESLTDKVKSTQIRNLVILILIVGIGLFILTHFLSNSTSHQSADKTEKPVFASALTHVDAESYVLERTQKQLHEAEKKTNNLQQQMDILVKNQSIEGHEKSQATIDLEKRIAVLEKELSAKQDVITDAIKPRLNGSEEYQNQFLSGVPINHGAESHSIREDQLSLTHMSRPEDLIPLRNPDSYVPAGTFVKAVMIGGADASAAVNAQANPVPMLFRLVANGTLPNHKKSHLKDCVVTAAVVGDISSERGQIRLENLSCTFPNNEVVDQAVEGTVFGPEGKNGVRGIPVWREGALLERAFAAGTLSGLSNGLSQTYTANSISAEGTVQTINPSKIFQYGAASGAGKAMDKLAEYNIDRAEQYHPVIQLSAGTVVDVVFLKGFYLDGQKHEKETNHPENDTATLRNAPTLFPPDSEAKVLPLSPDAVKRIQENSKQLGLRVTTLPNNGI